jgi:predicted TIM-barrel fold metal-dependent hydrolase
MDVIDIHTHAFPDNLAQRAIARLEGECPWRAVADGTVGALLKSMDAAGVAASVICNIATKPEQVEPILNWCKTVRSERIIPFPSVHPFTVNPMEWFERFREAGFVGIKLHPMYQSFAADEAQMHGIYAAASATGVLVEIHSGCDIAFPLSDDRASPERLRGVIDRFPKLKLLCTHLGGWQSWEAVERCLIGTQVYLETSFTFAYLGLERTVELMRRHGTDRVLFGTDWPWKAQADEVQTAARLGLTDAEHAALMGCNAAELLGIRQ